MGTESFIPYTTLPLWALIVIVLIGIGLLWKGGDYLTDGASALGVNLKIDPIIIGLTIVSIATSLPELMTSMIAAFKGSPDVAVGNIIGSNIANIGLILGVAGLFWPFNVHSGLVKMEMPILVGATAVFCVLGYFGMLDRVDGVILLICVVAYLIFVVKRRSSAGELGEELAENIPDEHIASGKAILLVALGAFLLALGSDGLVNSAVETARRIGVSELLIGITMVALGTSLPELAATVAAGMKKQTDIVAGNIVGSNLFNMLLIGGSVAVVQPMPFARSLFRFEIPIMCLMTLLLWRFFASNKKISRREGGVLLAFYVIAMGVTSWLQLRG